MSPIFVKSTYAVALALASAAFWLASNTQVPAVLFDRLFSLATQVAGLALAVAAILVALPTPDPDYVLQGRRRRVGQMSAILAMIGVLCATAGILSPDLFDHETDDSCAGNGDTRGVPCSYYRTRVNETLKVATYSFQFNYVVRLSEALSADTLRRDLIAALEGDTGGGFGRLEGLPYLSITHVEANTYQVLCGSTKGSH